MMHIQWVQMSEGYKAFFSWWRANTSEFLRGLYEMMRLRHFAILAAVLPFNAHAQSQCPDYSSFSQVPQGNASSGPLKLPFMRPSPECRTFTSPAVEKVIVDMKARLKDPDLARLFENTFPNTLDTTVKYFNASNNLAFIITGDITAQWLRDTGNQFANYHALLPLDKNLATLQKAVINNEARYIQQFPYCGSFQPPPESGLPTSHNAFADGVTVNPPVNNTIVFECKYEIDSLCGFMKLSRSYYQNTNDSSFMNANWNAAIDQIFRVIDEQSQPTFDANFNVISFYNWTGGNGALSPAVPNEGNGEPKAYTGMVGTHHRPSDDISIYAFLTPANAMLSVELTHLADMLDAVQQRQDVSVKARQLSKRISDAVWQTTLVENIFAYETNGFGGRVIMDDANVPSLLSLPYLGFLDMHHPAYVTTRKAVLSRNDPYFASGNGFFGVGGPHVDVFHPWPMSLISSIFGTDDDDEITTALYTIANNTAGLGLIHESQSIYNHTDFTRSWFAWVNSYFAEMMLDLAQRKPELIFKNNTPYVVGHTT
ncbi:Six-hairpin glycosidase-like protein [Gautieria morchelliformis]|nr:Six-hairpin glycosidase-like protein [Gautieria morchelliformis]